jgi:hypothetical protein
MSFSVIIFPEPFLTGFLFNKHSLLMFILQYSWCGIEFAGITLIFKADYKNGNFG